MSFSKLRVVAALMGMGLVVNLAPPAQAAAQSVSYYINGDCSDYYDQEGEYAFFESEPDWSCYMSVVVKPVKPVRTVRLQFWSGTKWKQESSAKTASNGRGYLYFDPYCSDGAYCDGEYKYRITVDGATGQKATTSNNFYINYYPDTGSDW